MRKGQTPTAGRPIGTRTAKHMRFVPGKMILRVKGAAVRPALHGPLAMTVAASRAVPAAVSEPLEYLRRNAGLKHVAPLFSTRRQEVARARMTAADRTRLAVLSSVAHSSNEDLAGINVVDLDPRKITPGLMKHLRASKAVEIAEPMPARWLQRATAADPLTNRQWALRAINWFQAHRTPAGSVTAGVMDTGVDTTHPELRGVINAYHHDGLGARDLLGHGTHVSGIIAAKVNNAIGIAGVAACKLTVWKIFEDQPADDGEFYVDGERFLRALGEARNAGVRVVNLSLGGTESSQTEQLLFRRLEAAGVVVVAAMGNEYQEGNPTEYPAAYQTVMAVGSVAETLRRSAFSNTGRHIALVAPGSNILSTLPLKTSPYLDETEYAAWSGTSMATPHVAAAAALVAVQHPGWNAAKIKARVRATARKLPGMQRSRWTAVYGDGLLDLKGAL